jgi:hypothetical protein
VDEFARNSDATLVLAVLVPRPRGQCARNVLASIYLSQNRLRATIKTPMAGLPFTWLTFSALAACGTPTLAKPAGPCAVSAAGGEPAIACSLSDRRPPQWLRPI